MHIVSNVKVQNQIIRKDVVKIGFCRNLVTCSIFKQGSFTLSLLLKRTFIQPMHKGSLKVQNLEHSWLELDFLLQFLGKPRTPKSVKFTYLVPIIVSQWCHLGKKHNCMGRFIFNYFHPNT